MHITPQEVDRFFLGEVPFIAVDVCGNWTVMPLVYVMKPEVYPFVVDDEGDLIMMPLEYIKQTEGVTLHIKAKYSWRKMEHVMGIGDVRTELSDAILRDFQNLLGAGDNTDAFEYAFEYNSDGFGLDISIHHIHLTKEQS